MPLRARTEDEQHTERPPLSPEELDRLLDNPPALPEKAA
jgi:hypothetical protein